LKPGADNLKNQRPKVPTTQVGAPPYSVETPILVGHPIFLHSNNKPNRHIVRATPSTTLYIRRISSITFAPPYTKVKTPDPQWTLSIFDIVDICSRRPEKTRKRTHSKKGPWKFKRRVNRIFES
jgi:hypothetical protein